MWMLLIIVTAFTDVYYWIGSLFLASDSDDQTRVPTWLGFTLWLIAVVGLIATVIVVATAG